MKRKYYINKGKGGDKTRIYFSYRLDIMKKIERRGFPAFFFSFFVTDYKYDGFIFMEEALYYNESLNDKGD